MDDCIWSNTQVKEMPTNKIRGFLLSCSRLSFLKKRQLLNNSKVMMLAYNIYIMYYVALTTFHPQLQWSLLDCSWRDYMPSGKSRIISPTHEKRTDTGLHPFYPLLPVLPIMAAKGVPPPIRSKPQVKDLDVKETRILS